MIHHRSRLLICFLILCIWDSISFLTRISPFTRLSLQYLFPLERISSFHSNFPKEYHNLEWKFHLLEDRNLLEASNLATECFYKPRLDMDLNSMTGLKKILAIPIVFLFNAADKFDYTMTNYLGFKSRSSKRLEEPSLALTEDSFILAVTVASNQSMRTMTRKPSNVNIREDEIIGIVEVSLEKPDGRLAPPVKITLLPTFINPSSSDYQPYLCNLCVKSSYRRRKLGIILCELSEIIVKKYWNKNDIYLHVDKENLAARRLYETMGYEACESLLPDWESKLLGVDSLVYYHRRLDDI